MFFWIAPISGFALFALNEIANPRGAFLGKVLWRGDRRGIALTFDDGPHPFYTSKVLEILNTYQAKATFFVIGKYLTRHGTLVAEASKAGHLIGNHSFNHFRTMNFFPREKLRQEILECQNEVERWVGYRPVYYRQPFGLRNPNIFRILKELKMAMVGWQVRAFDTQIRDPQIITWKILRKKEPGGIILLHDGSDSSPHDDRTGTLKALPEILQRIKDQGIEFLTLDQLLGMRKEIEENG